MGELPRGGFYSYLWVNDSWDEVENAARILPDFRPWRSATF
jgi:hypothetical protein